MQIQSRIPALRNLENDPFRNRPKADIKKLEGTTGREFIQAEDRDYRAVYAVEGIPQGNGIF
jgi:hypothetical protein